MFALPPALAVLALLFGPAAQESDPARSRAADTFDRAATLLADGRGAYARGALPAACDALGAALEQAPGEPQIRLWLARVLNDLERGEEAAAVLAPALAAAPGSAWLSTEQGRALALQGDAEGARAELERALETRPGCGGARFHLARLTLAAGRAAEAHELLAPLREAPGQPAAVRVLAARILLALDRVEEAESVLRSGLDPAPGARDVRRELACLLVDRERFEEAWSVAAVLLEEARDPEVLRFVAGVADRCGRIVDAAAALAAAWILDPADTDALAGFGELLEHRAFELRAALALRRLAANGEDVEAWREFLEVSLDQGRLDRFFEELATVPLDLRAHPRLGLLEGEALRRAGRNAEARPLLMKLSEGVGATRAWYELGLLDYAEGRFEEAASAFERGSEGHWASDAHYNRGVCLDRVGRYAEAARAYEAAVALTPALVEGWLQLGHDRRFRLGDAAGARSAYERYLVLGGDDPEVRRWAGEER